MRHSPSKKTKRQKPRSIQTSKHAVSLDVSVRFLRRLFFLLRRLIFVAILLALILGITSITPIFATVTGTLLGWLGDWYAKDLQTGNSPNAYVVLGGGLTSDSGIIILNHYSRQRAATAAKAYQHQALPVVVSGAEAPWIVAELIKDVPSLRIFAENASMNTCENANFSVKLINHYTSTSRLPSVSHVYLVSDWYHMARARRQFARLGLATTPVIAPMPTDLAWDAPKSNLSHSRRAFYEIVALARDILRPQDDCRDADEVSVQTLMTPRGQVAIF